MLGELLEMVVMLELKVLVVDGMLYVLVVMLVVVV